VPTTTAGYAYLAVGSVAATSRVLAGVASLTATAGSASSVVSSTFDTHSSPRQDNRAHDHRRLCLLGRGLVGVASLTATTGSASSVVSSTVATRLPSRTTVPTTTTGYAYLIVGSVAGTSRVLVGVASLTATSGSASSVVSSLLPHFFSAVQPRSRPLQAMPIWSWARTLLQRVLVTHRTPANLWLCLARYARWGVSAPV
jgi:hypothetical protein